MPWLLHNSLNLPDFLQRFLSHPWEAVLATRGRSGHPHQTVMWYGLGPDHLYMTSLEHRVKVKNIRRDPRASLLVFGPGCYASLAGRVSIVTDPDLAQSCFRSLVRRYGAGEEFLAKRFSPERVVLELRPEKRFSHGTKAWLSRENT